MSDSSRSNRLLLSEILANHDGFIMPDELSQCAKLAEEISGAALPSEEEVAWLADFNKNIFRAVSASNSLDYLVAARATAPVSATDYYLKNQTYDSTLVRKMGTRILRSTRHNPWAGLF